MFDEVEVRGEMEGGERESRMEGRKGVPRKVVSGLEVAKGVGGGESSMRRDWTVEERKGMFVKFGR